MEQECKPSKMHYYDLLSMGSGGDPSSCTVPQYQPKSTDEQRRVSCSRVNLSTSRRKAGKDPVFGKISKFVRKLSDVDNDLTTSPTAARVSLYDQERALEERRELRNIMDSLRDFNSLQHQEFIFRPFDQLHAKFKPKQLIEFEEQVKIEVDELSSEEELDFATEDLTRSVRKLVSRIKNDSSKEIFLQEATSSTDEEEPEDLTASVRRLVINLKHDSDDYHKKPAQALRRIRGSSCPPHIADEAKAPPSAKTSCMSIIRPGIMNFLRRKKKTYLFTDEELETIEGARWKIIELAFRFGGKHRYYLAQAVNMFFPLTKYGRRGEPHSTRLHCNCCGTLQWQQKRGGMSRPIDLADTISIIEGRHTAVFRRHADDASLQSCSLSLIFETRTLDLETQTPDHRDWLMSALRTLVTYARKQRSAEARAIQDGDDNKVERASSTGKESTWPLDTLCQKLFGVPTVA